VECVFGIFPVHIPNHLNMDKGKLDFSTQAYARIGGVAYLFIIFAGLIGEMFIRNTLIVPGDAAATAANISRSPLLWRIGIAGDLAMHACDLIVTLVYFILLRPVNRNLALLALLFGMIQTAVLVANKMNLVMPLLLLDDHGYLKSIDAPQRHALAYLSVKAHGYGFGIGLVFFGFECLIDGYLIARSGFLPRILGHMIQLAGLCYLVNSFALILFPGLAEAIFPAILAPAFIGELSICLWLIVKGVNVPKWREWVEQKG
jgi:hypothetical protein